jgi:hypothetical protein
MRAEGPWREEFLNHAKSKTTTFAETHIDPQGARRSEEPLALGVSELP